MFEIDKRNNRELPYQPYNPMASIFNDFLYREKEIINDYWTDEPYRVIFRQNNNKNQTNDYSTIFYPVEEDITQGRLLKILSEYYLVLNHETIENPIYRKSDLVKCNVIIYTFSNGKEIVIPAHVLGLTDPYGDNNSAISVVSGSIEILTEHCELAESIDYNSTFYIIGGKYKVNNKIWNDGIIRLFAEREADSTPPEYELEIDLKSSYAVGTTEVLKTVAKRIDENSTDIVTNATIIWDSSDNSIVSFVKDGSGNTDGTAMFHSTGLCEICAIWKEHNVISKTLLAVENAATIKKFSEITYSGLAEVKQGGSSKLFTSNFYDENNNLTGFIYDNNDNLLLVSGYEPIWSLELPYPAQEGNVVITERKGRTVRVQANSKAPIGTNFFLKLDCSNGEYDTAYLYIDIVDLW